MRWALSPLFLLLVSGSPATKEALPFIEDDFPKALSEARARNVPIFIEAWAPW